MLLKSISLEKKDASYISLSTVKVKCYVLSMMILEHMDVPGFNIQHEYIRMNVCNTSDIPGLSSQYE